MDSIEQMLNRLEAKLEKQILENIEASLSKLL